MKPTPIRRKYRAMRVYKTRPAGWPTIFTDLRIEKGVTLLEVSKATGVNTASINYYEQGIRSPKLTTAEKLLNFYGYELEAMPK